MALEPINATMTLQAQTIQPYTNSSTSKPATEYTDVTLAAENAPKVDETTKVVENVENKEDPKNRFSEQTQNQTNETQQSSSDALQKAVENLNKKMMNNSEAIFGIHEGTNRITIKIVDKDTKKVIKELPAEKTLDMIAKVWEMAGILVDEQR